MAQLLGSSATYRIAVGPRAGQKAFTLHRTAPTAPRSHRRGGGVGHEMAVKTELLLGAALR